MTACVKWRRRGTRYVLSNHIRAWHTFPPNLILKLDQSSQGMIDEIATLYFLLSEISLAPSRISIATLR